MIGFYKAYYNRGSCYQCDFVSKNRVGDITLGDFWGFKLAHPELKKEDKYGISCVLINSRKGMDLLSSANNILSLHKSSLEKCANKQPSLNHTNPRPSYRDHFFFLT